MGSGAPEGQYGKLMIFPVMLGSGKRIFPEMEDKLVFDLTDHRQYGSIVVHD
jgi:hypothetical protein